MSENKDKNVQCTSTILYNNELWTTATAKINKSINCIQRHFLRKIIGIKWTKVISNKTLKEKGKKPWNIVLKRKARMWLDHIFRMDEKTQGRRALKECKIQGY